MSGITGIYYVDERPIDRADLGRMVDILAHRGPDGAKVWSEGAIGLGHRMLWTTPESLLEQLPLINQTGEIVLTADARIDNREELIAALGLTDRSREKITDSQLILSAYETWGASCPERLLGDFAFAIWDGRKQVLFCARDHFGVKPFYYYHHPGRIFIFASEIKALLCLPEVPRQLNEVMVGDYLEEMVEDKVITFYKDIFRLPPAHSLTISHKGIQLQPYWSLDPTRELWLGSDEEYAEAYREIFTEAVRCRLRSAFPVGSALSGGLDSSSITCVARELLAENGNCQLHTFSAIFDKVRECDERPFINAVLAQGGVEPHYLHADQISPLTDIDRVLWHEDEPFCCPNLFIHWGLYGSAQQQGVRIFLDGFGGDSTVLHGWEYLIELARTARWLTLVRAAKAAAKRHGESPWGLTWEYMWHDGIKPRLPQKLWQARRLLRRRSPPAPRFSKIINPELRERISLLNRVRAFQQDQSQPLQSAREYHYQELVTGEFPSVLEVLNKAASAFAIETCYPFADRRLAEFCLAIPPEQRLYNGWTRGIVRRALVNRLPEKVCWRTDKGNAAPNFHHGLLTFDRERLEEVILNNPKVIEAYVDVAALRVMYQQYASQENPEDCTPPAWLAVTLALWLRHKNLNS